MESADGFAAFGVQSGIPTGYVYDYLHPDFAAKNPSVVIDYIHGEDTLARLAVCGAIGIFCEDFRKDSLFTAVAKDGPLPRKTFSMGHAWDKRYYLEARRIIF